LLGLHTALPIDETRFIVTAVFSVLLSILSVGLFYWLNKKRINIYAKVPVINKIKERISG